MLHLQSTRTSAGGLRQTTPRSPSMAQAASCTRPWPWTWPQQGPGARLGPSVAAISTTNVVLHGESNTGKASPRTTNVQHMVDSLPGESSDFLPDKWLVDSGADLNICVNYELFSCIGPSDVDICTPIGSTPLDVLGRGVIKMGVGHYVDHNGPSHPIDLDIEDVYWVPQCPMNVLATPCIAEQNMYLYTGPRGNELYVPGFADQSLGVFDKCTQEMDHDGNPVIVFNQGKGRPIMNSHPVGIGKAKYALVVVDECTRYSWAFPMQKKAQTVPLLALLIQRINTQTRRPGEPGVRRLHTNQGGEFKSTSPEEVCLWKGIIHTFTDRAQQQSNGLVERKIGQLNESTLAALLASNVPAYLWPEVYMAMCHTQNIVPCSELQRELKKDKKDQLLPRADRRLG